MVKIPTKLILSLETEVFFGLPIKPSHLWRQLKNSYEYFIHKVYLHSMNDRQYYQLVRSMKYDYRQLQFTSHSNETVLKLSSPLLLWMPTADPWSLTEMPFWLYLLYLRQCQVKMKFNKMFGSWREDGMLFAEGLAVLNSTVYGWNYY